jgi:ABC-type sugar transport system substrate-binding protein
MIGRSRTVRRRIGIVLAVSMMAATWAGCGNDFVTPPPSVSRDEGGSGERVSTTADSKPTTEPFVLGGTVRRIDFIVSSRVDAEQAQIEEAAARMQAGYDRARLHFLPKDDTGNSDRPGNGSAASSAAGSKSQAELIRGSLAAKPQAIIVDPDDPEDKELAHAIHEARAARVPVVVLGRPIPEVGEAKSTVAAPMIVVAPQSFADSASQIVKLAIRNLKNAKIDPARGAVLLISASGDRFVPDRVAAVREALKAAKVASIDELRIPKEITAGAAALKKHLQGDPKPVMVFFFDFNGAAACKEVASDLGEKRPFVRAGYTSDDGRTRMVRSGEYAAVGEYEPTRLIRKAVTVAAAAAQRRESKEKEEIPINVLESPPGSGVASFEPRREAPPEAPKKGN